MNKGRTQGIKDIHKEIQNTPYSIIENVGDFNKLSGNEADVSEIYQILNDTNSRYPFLG